jgi:hypothetical protein
MKISEKVVNVLSRNTAHEPKYESGLKKHQAEPRDTWMTESQSVVERTVIGEECRGGHAGPVPCKGERQMESRLGRLRSDRKVTGVADSS